MLQRTKAIIRRKVHHLHPQVLGEQGFVMVAAPVPNSLVGSHPVHETAVQKERDVRGRGTGVCRG